MQGDADVIELLNEVLTAELTAINQYFIHAKMCDNWGYDRLAVARARRVDRRDEARRADHRADPLPRRRAQHAAAVPGPRRRDRPRAVPGRRRAGVRRRRALNRGIALAVERGDNGTRELLADILVSEEDHIDWLETQQETIRQIGLERYLAEQLHD